MQKPFIIIHHLQVIPSTMKQEFKSKTGRVLDAVSSDLKYDANNETVVLHLLIGMLDLLLELIL